MNTYELKEKLDKLLQIELQEGWDNSGLLLGFNKDIKKILITLDVTGKVVEEGIREGVDLILSHHPLIFSPIRSLDENNGENAVILKLIENKISVYSSHTDVDAMPGGINDYIGELLDLESYSLLMDGDAFTRVGYLKESLSLEGFIEYLVDKLSLNRKSIKYVPGKNTDAIKKIAWCSGSGTEFMMNAYLQGVDCFITGDIKYHQGRSAEELGLNLIDFTHYGSEIIYIDLIHRLLEDKLAGVELIKSKENNDPFNY